MKPLSTAVRSLSPDGSSNSPVQHGESFSSKRKSPNRLCVNIDSSSSSRSTASTRSSVDLPTSVSDSSSIGIRSSINTWCKQEEPLPQTPVKTVISKQGKVEAHVADMRSWKRPWNPWSCSILTFLVAILAAALTFTIVRSFQTRQLDPKGCAMSYMAPAFAKFSDFDTEHTRFASKYSLYLYRERGVDEDTRVKGVPILFIPGNAGSYKQVRPLAAQAAVYYHDTMKNDPAMQASGKRPLDFFSVDFNEDITAFHGQTLLDQAEYLNEAISYILGLYHNPHRSSRDGELPDPTSVILVGHSMGGIVARTILTLPSYQTNSINTILTLAAPHARAPVSFDAEVVSIYKRVNKYWRDSYSQSLARDNPLWQVTLVSIAGGGLDTIVPSDYSTIASLVPPSHGFTVFTSTIPHVWSGMDHLEITWCNQLRHSVIKSLYDVINANSPSQTRSRVDRMQAFRKRLLTGLELDHDNGFTKQDPNTILTLEDHGTTVLTQGDRLVLRSFGEAGHRKTYLMPVPAHSLQTGKRFSLLTDQALDTQHLQVMSCSIYDSHSTPASDLFTMNPSDDDSGSTRLACRDAATDVVTLPASYSTSRFPFDDAAPFSYLRYSLDRTADEQFIAVIDRSTENMPGWLIAEFTSQSEVSIVESKNVRDLIQSGIDITARKDRAMVTEIHIPSMHSSLLAYKLRIADRSCEAGPELFSPLVRQSISEIHESKFFVNAHYVDISMHGIAPYIPTTSRTTSRQGLSLQIWMDPTCNEVVPISLRIDVLGSMGKLWMRYRTVCAALPLLVVALVLRKQFEVFDHTGVFLSFTECLDTCLRRSIPVALSALVILGLCLSASRQESAASESAPPTNNGTFAGVKFYDNDILLGSQDAFFWFLVPLFGLISVGVCILLNYITIVLTHSLALIYTQMRRVISKSRSRKNSTPAASASTTVTPFRRRLAILAILLLLVATVIPYQFLYIVLCVVQLLTCARALSEKASQATHTFDFYNYTQSLLLIMLWILPINIPVLVVWSRNLAVHWLTPFSSHHNVLSIMPFVLLVEMMSVSRTIPQSKNWLATHVTSLLLYGLAAYSAVYGVSYAYMLHNLVNVVCAWLVMLHLIGNEENMKTWSSLLRTGDIEDTIITGYAADLDTRVKKRP